MCIFINTCRRLGDGGKWVCDPHRITEQKDCLVYSVGSNNDFSFEMAVLKDIGPHCEIHTVRFIYLLVVAAHILLLQEIHIRLCALSDSPTHF